MTQYYIEVTTALKANVSTLNKQILTNLMYLSFFLLYTCISRNRANYLEAIILCITIMSTVGLKRAVNKILLGGYASQSDFHIRAFAKKKNNNNYNKYQENFISSCILLN